MDVLMYFLRSTAQMLLCGGLAVFIIQETQERTVLMVEYRIIKEGTYIVQIKVYKPTKWWKVTPETEWKTCFYALCLPDAEAFVEKYKNHAWTNHFGSVCPVVKHGFC